MGLPVGRLIAGFVLVSVVPLALLTWFGVSLSTKAVRSQAEARVRDTATSSAVAVGQEMDSLAELVRSYAQRPTLLAAMRQPSTPHNHRMLGFHLAELQQARRGIAIAFVAQPDGRLLDIVPATPAIVGKDFSFRDWYHGVTTTTTTTTTGRPYVSEVYETAAAGHARVVAAAVQIRAPGTKGKPGRVMGVLVAGYELDSIQRFVSQFSAARDVQLTVTDQRGVLLASPATSPRGLRSRRDDPLVAAALRGQAGVSERTTPAGRVLSAYQPVTGVGWTVTAEVATATAFAPVHQLRGTVLAIATVLGLVLLGGLVLLASSLRQRVRAEQQLRASEEGTWAILEAANEAFISMDTRGGITGWNAQAEQTFGWSRTEAVGRNLAQTIIPAPLRDAHEQGRQRYLATGEGRVLNQRIELTALHRDGHQFPVEIVIWPVGSGEQTSFNAFAHDISLRRRAEEAVRASEERLGLALEAASMGYWDWNIPSGETVWSPQLEVLFGFGPGSLDSAEAFTERVHPADREVVQGWVEAAANGGPSGELQFRVTLPDGEIRWMQTRAQVYRDGGGRPVRMVGVVVDVTERQHSEEALNQAKHEADQANRAKSEFLSRMSHELRTPLNAILGFGQLLQRDELTEGQRESADQVLRGGRHLLGLINEVLDVSRIETGSLALSREAVNVHELLNETIDLIRPLAAEREVHIEVPSLEGGSWTVRADRQRLRQVLLNLASNAVKYNRHGGTIEFVCQAAADGRVRVLVRDTGPGVPADKLPRLFTPFDRLGAELTDIQGTGMGLALSKRLTEAMGGTLTADSIEGKGSSFTVELARAEDPLEHYQQALAAQPTRVQHPDSASERTVLYIEDNPANLRLVQRVLAERGGVRLFTATHGEPVQDLVRQHRPDLVLLDQHLPDLGGEEVLRRLQADPETAAVPVVVVSADATAGQIQRLLAAGASHYLTKPLDVAQFLEVVDQLLHAAHHAP
jgi:PAS domain S-box-containing protein